MLGYVRAYKPEMKFKDYEAYKGVYCSLCKVIGKRYGLIARLTLSYDFTFFAILRMALVPECPGFTKSHCSFNPAKKCMDCSRDNRQLEYVADVSMLTAYHKLKDNISDSGFFKRIFCKMLLPYAKRIYKKARARVVNEADLAEKLMKKQAEVEKKSDTGTDEAADMSAKLLSGLLVSGIDCENKNELERFGYCFGRWVYLIDAVDDCKKDIKSGSFNPLKNKFNSDDFKDYCEELLNLSMGEAARSFEKLKIYRFYDILSNIIYDGSEAVMKKVLQGEAGK